MGPELLTLACWVIFVLYWLVSAFSSKAAAERQSRRDMLAHRLPTYAGCVLLFAPRADPWGVHLLARPYAMRWAGAALCVVGLVGALASRKILAGNWSANVEFKKEHQLVERGPYRFVRHPIYSSLLLMCFGAALVTNRLVPLLSLALIFIGFLIKLRQEERLLRRHFPEQYPAYQRRTKMLIPFVC